MAQKSESTSAEKKAPIKSKVTAVKTTKVKDVKKTTKAKTTATQTSKTKTKRKSKESMKAEKRFAVVRIRGINNVRKDINDTIGFMNLRRINNLTFVDDRPAYKGMLQKSKDFITWGEPEVELVAQLLKKWGRVLGDKPLTDSFVAEHSKFKTIDEFAKNFVEMKAELTDIATLKPFLRLHPPKGGFKGKGIKYAFKANGALGYRGSEINDLIKNMSGL